MEILLKLMRGIVFPFRFMYLVWYAWITDRRRARYLARMADPQRNMATPPGDELT